MGIRDTSNSTNTQVLEYVSHLAATFRSNGLLSDIAADEVVIGIANQINPSNVDSSKTALEICMSYDKTFGALCETRYGKYNLCANLLRFESKQHLAALLSTLSKFGQELIEKAKLCFNQPFFIYADESCQKRVLASQFIIDMVEHITNCHNNMMTLTDAFLELAPSQIECEAENSYNLDHELAKHLGFMKISGEILIFEKDNRFIRDLTHGISQLMHYMQTAAEQLKQNLTSNGLARLMHLTQHIDAECQKITRLPLKPSGDYAQWELRKNDWFTSLHVITASLDTMRGICADAIRPVHLKHQKERLWPSLALMHKIEDHLIAAGHKPIHAREAVDRLKNYCQLNKITTQKLIEAEFSKIDPIISDSAIALWRAYEQKHSFESASEKVKDQVLLKSQSLRKSLEITSQILLVFLIIFGTVGCGLKTAVRSNVQDLRPEIPYKASSETAGKAESQALESIKKDNKKDEKAVDENDKKEP